MYIFWSSEQSAARNEGLQHFGQRWCRDGVSLSDILTLHSFSSGFYCTCCC